MLAVFTVSTNSDDGPGSLRQAIKDANAAPGSDTLEFAITGSRTISPRSGLPSVTDTLLIDGWSQPGFDNKPLVTIDGGQAGDTQGLVIRANSSVVRGLIVRDFERNGIYVQDSADVVIQGNYIGTNNAGSGADANGRSGIVLDETTGVLVGVPSGSSQPEIERNIVSGNEGDGIYVLGGSANVIAGNFIGVGADGTTAVPNDDDGVTVASGANPSTGNTVGGDSTEERNIISGNGDDGVVIWSSNSNTVSGNYIGLASDGETAVANGDDGVTVGTALGGSPAMNNIIGGQGNSERNVIAGNIDDGISVWGASGTSITANYVGVAADGVSVLPNDVGVSVYPNSDGVGADASLIGGNSFLLRNIISGNSRYGVVLGEDQVTNTEIVNNFVGLGVDGATVAGNGLDGVHVWGAVDTTITQNWISGNGSDGIDLSNEADGTVIQTNYIGTNEAGAAAIPNTYNGVRIRGGATDSLVGGPQAGLANVIAGNTRVGVHLHDVGTRNNTVEGNWIGTTQSGSRAIPNEYGVVIEDAASENTIGGLVAGAGNLISGNRDDGIWIGDSGTNLNVVQGNRIGTDDAGDSSLGNATGIVVANGARGNVIGGSGAAASNLIAGNLDHGIWLGGHGTEDNVLQGNLIGTVASGEVALANGRTGIVITDGAKNNQIGGSDSGNVISGNLHHGIWVGDFETSDNPIQGNLIGTSATGNSGIPNGYDGIIFVGAGHHLVGGSESGQGNVISANGDDGITILRGAQEQVIQGNHIGVGLDGVTALGNGDEGVQILGGDLQGNPPTIIYVIDRSSSTDDPFEGTPVGDVNGDGLSDTILDAELAGFINFTEKLVDLGYGDVVQVGISTFNSSAQSLDVDPHNSGKQLATPVGADNDSDSKLDIVEALKTVRFGGNTSFRSGLQSAIDSMTTLGTNTGDGNIIFVSDGEDLGGSFQTQLDTLTTMGVNRIALGIGEDSDLSRLQQIDPDADKVLSSDEFTNSLLAVLGLNPNQSGSTGPAGTNVMVGGTQPGEGNTIANNLGDGVRVGNFLATGNSILGNSIYNNGHLGIELDRNGVELNDHHDADSGANDLTNYPVIAEAILQADRLCFEGTLAAEPNQSYRVELFGNRQSDSSGHGEGEMFLGFVNVTTDANGNASLSDAFDVPVVDFDFVSATATVGGAGGSTSEFSAAVEVSRREPGFEIAQSGSDTLINESGSSDSFTVVLTAKPESPVVLSVTSDDTGEAEAAANAVTFTATNWDVPQPVVMTGVDDEFVDGRQESNVIVSVIAAESDDLYDDVQSQSVSVFTDDNEVAGFEFVETGNETVVSERGTEDEFSVVLIDRPLADVIIEVEASDTGEANASPETLTFTSDNWSVMQTVVVTGVDDAIADGPESTLVRLAINDDDSQDLFDDIEDQTLSVLTTDDDAAFSISTSEAAVDESGTSDSFDVVLDAEPVGDVVLTVQSTDTGEVSASPSNLTFDPANWSTPQTVTLTGVDDAIADGAISSSIVVRVDLGKSHAAFSGVPEQEVVVVTTDDDSPGLVLIESEDKTLVRESGAVDTVGLRLSARPAGVVVVYLESADTGEVLVAPVRLTFSPANWDVEQEISISAVDDADRDGRRVTLVTLGVDADASHVGFHGQSAEFEVTSIDNDSPAYLDEKDLFVRGTDGDDTITMTEAAGEVTVTLNGDNFVFNTDDYVKVRVSSLKGDDLVDASGMQSRVVARLAGGEDEFHGGTGNDIARGGGGADTLFGNDGNDSLSTGSGNDVINGGSGHDTARSADGHDTIHGGPGLDTIAGGTGRDSLFGESGRDKINGGASRDYISGGSGADTLAGGRGPDTLFGDSGNDLLDGENSNDEVTGGEGRDLAIGGKGEDAVFGGEDDDVLISGRVDLSVSQLTSILAEWGSDRSYAIRVANVRGGFDATSDRLNDAYLVGSDRTDRPQTAVGTGDGTLEGNLGDDMFFATLNDSLGDKADDEWLDQI